jgi:hypothetical protein
MDSYKQIYSDWKSWKWVNGTTNCKEEQECEITSFLFTEPVKPLFTPVYTYSIIICWRIKDLKFKIYLTKNLKDGIKDNILWKDVKGRKKINLFSI